MNNTFGLKVKCLRESKGLSQEELAHMVGLKTKGGISRIENGQRFASTPMIQKLAIALGVNPATLIDIDDVINIDPKYSDLVEFLPYLYKADEGTLTSIRKLLDMPPKKNSK